MLVVTTGIGISIDFSRNLRERAVNTISVATTSPGRDREILKQCIR